MSRASRRLNRLSSIRANNDKIKSTTAKSNFQQNTQHDAEVERLKEKYGVNKHTKGENGNNQLW